MYDGDNKLVARSPPSKMKLRRGKPSTRNVTVVLEQGVARWARLAAAERDTSVSQFLGSLLKERMLAEHGYETAMREALREKPLSSKWKGRYPTRDEIHDRR